MAIRGGGVVAAPFSRFFAVGTVISYFLLHEAAEKDPRCLDVANLGDWGIMMTGS